MEKRWLWVFRQLMMWFVTVDHRWAERIAPTLNTWQSDYHHLQHSAARLTVGDLLIISISRGSFFSVYHMNICIHLDHCQILWGLCHFSGSSMDGRSVHLSNPFGPDCNLKMYWMDDLAPLKMNHNWWSVVRMHTVYFTYNITGSIPPGNLCGI